MTDSSTPEGTVEQSSAPETSADALLDKFLDASEPEHASEEQDEHQDAPEAELDDDAQDDADPLADNEAADDDQASDDDGDQPSDSGRFVSDDGKVRLADGSVVTIGELKRSSLREADYTRKTQELAAHRKELEARYADIAQKAQSFEQQASLAIEILAAHMPQEPDISTLRDDPVGYWEQKAQYDARLQQLHQLQAARQYAAQEQQARVQHERAQYLHQQKEALLAAMPELQDPAKANSFTAELVNTIEVYGFSKEDLGTVEDHRLFLLARDAMAYRKLMAAKPKAKAKAEGKPPLAPGRRQGPTAGRKNDRQQDWQRLRNSGGKDEAALDRILDNLV
ncbi:hypothetical protein ACFOLL_04420 [Falsochrobactrum ovis]|uniref:Scaffolding protein n=1 Tax=Falsochrobactrum ovis TaxID=1293442 RepID=A0A364JVK4_9HYPH|nr:hypothetical protein [Falsochrobactrum ovis]RAK29144.1 hypothetical protein C7374_105195 [Falsochrobactrum ovis]